MAYGVGQVEQPKLLTPADHLANALKLRADQLEIDQRTQEMAQKLRQEAETQKNQAWLQTAARTYQHEDGSPDWATITKAAGQYNPAFALELGDRVSKAQAAEADLHTKELKNNLDSYGMVATLGEHVNDQDSYDRFLKASSQIDPTFQGPPQYDPAFMKQVVEKGYLNADYMKRHLELEKQASEGLIGADKYLGGVLSLAQSQEDVDDAFKGAATRYHLTADQVAGLKQEWGGQFGEGYQQHATQKALTPEQRQVQDRGKPAVGSFEDYVTRTYGATPTPAQVLEARKAYGQADDRPTVTVNTGPTSDVSEAVRGMKEGTLPPLLPGRATKEYLATMAEARRQNFDLAAAATDWAATQKHISSLNGTQQLRLNQAIGQLPELLDTVDTLASKWKAGRFPPLNKAQLIAAKNGMLGKDAASIANQLDAQIADVTSDLGAVYMGGTSPTDHSLKLAEKALSSDWDEKILHDMVALARKNVETRQHSIQNTGVQGASANNPYGQQPAAPATPKAADYVFDPTTGTMKKGGG